MSYQSGAELVAGALRELGASTVFTVSGNQVLPLMDACDAAGLRLVHARHESGAAAMAEAWGRLRGEPGVCLVTAGPGHTSVLTGIANARAAEAPLLVLSGASPVAQRGRGAFQELDQLALAAPLAIAASEPHDAAGAAPAVAAAWHAARRTPGPAHVSLPVDVLAAEAAPAPLPAADADAGAGGAAERVAALLTGAARPAVLARPALARRPHAALLERLERRVPVFVAESPRGLGDPAWDGGLAGADAVAILAPLDFAVGFGELPGAPRVEHAAGDGVLAALVPLLEAALPERRPAAATPPACPDRDEPLHPLAITDELRGRLGADELLVLDGGEFGQWMRAGLADRGRHQLLNGKLGAIGGAIPQAVGAALAAPERRVLAFAGDGAFGYHAAELDTAVRAGARLVVLVGNDARWSAEWHAQRERFGSGRTIATELEPRDYGLVARGYGAAGARARTRAELGAALDAALAPDAPPVTVVDVTIRSLRSPAAAAA